MSTTILKTARERERKSERWLARQMDVSQTLLRSMEDGHTTMRLDHALRAVRALNLSVSYKDFAVKHSEQCKALRGERYVAVVEAAQKAADLGVVLADPKRARQLQIAVRKTAEVARMDTDAALKERAETALDVVVKRMADAADVATKSDEPNDRRVKTASGWWAPAEEGDPASKAKQRPNWTQSAHLDEPPENEDDEDEDDDLDHDADPDDDDRDKFGRKRHPDRDSRRNLHGHARKSKPPAERDAFGRRRHGGAR